MIEYKQSDLEELEAEAETVAELIADLINWTDRKAMKVIKGRCLDYFKKMLDEYEHQACHAIINNDTDAMKGALKALKEYRDD